MDYVDAFNEGVEESRQELVQALAHPVDTITGILTMAWDGVNATTELAFGVTTEGAHARNMQHRRAINDGAVEFAHADGVAKTRMLSHGLSSVKIGAGTGGAAGIATKGLITQIPRVTQLGKFAAQRIKTLPHLAKQSKGLKSNPFQGKTFEEIDQLLSSRGFKKVGPNPAAGKGSYFHPKTGRKYYLDNGGIYKEGKELPHVDAHKMRDGINLESVGKRRYPLGNKLIEDNINLEKMNVNF